MTVPSSCSYFHSCLRPNLLGYRHKTPSKTLKKRQNQAPQLSFASRPVHAQVFTQVFGQLVRDIFRSARQACICLYAFHTLAFSLAGFSDFQQHRRQTVDEQDDVRPRVWCGPLMLHWSTAKQTIQLPLLPLGECWGEGCPQSTSRTKSPVRHQVNIRLIAVTAVLLLPSQFNRYAQANEYLHRRIGSGEAGAQLFAHLLNSKARHHRQHFKQPVAGWACLG